MAPSTISADQFLAAAKFRRTVYGLKASSPVPDSRIEEILKEVLFFFFIPASETVDKNLTLFISYHQYIHIHTFDTMAPNITADQFLAAAKYRRTVYGLKASSPVPDARIEEILKEVLSFAPSSYNTQSARFTLVLGEKHKQFWDIVIKESEGILKGAGAWDAMYPRFQAFQNAYGSVVFWEAGNTIKQAQDTHKASAHMFPEWSEHASGIHQILVWTALELEGFGANLQHMNAIPPVEAVLKKFLAVPEDWKLKAHLNFGEEAQPHPEIPSKLPASETLTIVK